MTSRLLALVAAGLLGAAEPAAAEFPPLLAEYCGACHAFAEPAPALPGPNLMRLAGRRLAGDPAYDYSPALRALGEAGRRWDRAGLEAFLKDPDSLAPGLWMSPVAFRSEAELQSVLDLLMTLR